MCALVTGFSGFYFSGIDCYEKGLLLDRLSNEVFVNNYNGWQRPCALSINILNKNSPRNKRYPQGNEIPFFTKK